MIANTPPLTDLPAYRACRPNPPRDGPSCFADSRLPPPEVIERAIDDYNAVIERVAARRGAEVVDLHARGLVARRAETVDRLVSSDGFHPSTEGHRAVANAFAAALAPAPSR